MFDEVSLSVHDFDAFTEAMDAINALLPNDDALDPVLFDYWCRSAGLKRDVALEQMRRLAAVGLSTTDAQAAILALRQ